MFYNFNCCPFVCFFLKGAGQAVTVFFFFLSCFFFLPRCFSSLSHAIFDSSHLRRSKCICAIFRETVLGRPGPVGSDRKFRFHRGVPPRHAHAGPESVQSSVQSVCWNSDPGPMPVRRSDKAETIEAESRPRRPLSFAALLTALRTSTGKRLKCTTL